MAGSTIADRMEGGSGDDTYYVDNPLDVIVEFATDQQFVGDVVRTSVSYILAAGVGVDFLQTIDQTDTAPFTLSGNELWQAITGNAGTNTLDGNGGNDHVNGGSGNDTIYAYSGNDTLNGGTGADTFYVDTSGDKVAEALGASSGFDTVYASANYVLTAGQGIEFLRAAAGTTGRVLVGNEIGQFVYGANGADGIQGLSGNDTLLGSGGNDGFYFNTTLNVDRILDFGQTGGRSV